METFSLRPKEVFEELRKTVVGQEVTFALLVTSTRRSRVCANRQPRCFERNATRDDRRCLS